MRADANFNGKNLLNMTNLTKKDLSPTQGIIPVFLTDFLDICDPVVVFDEIMKGIDLEKYLRRIENRTGRPRYNPVRILKTILYGFVDGGYASLRELEDRCRYDIRYKYPDGTGERYAEA